MSTTVFLFFLGILSLAVGFYASIMGNGSLVLVPFFVVTGMPILPAIATMRAGAIVQEFTAMLVFFRHESLDLWKRALPFWIIAFCFGGIGAYLAVQISQTILLFIAAFITIGILAFGFLLRQIHLKPIAHAKSLLILAGIPLAVYGGFFGGGFGMFMNMLSKSYFPLSQEATLGIARATGFFMSLSATFVFASFGVIRWHEWLFAALGLAAGSWMGLTMKERSSQLWIQWALTALAITCSVKIIFSP
ncbi:MAG TPA: sulfite exporter TauE/SafE family protein [Patescibacteria group bacterium]|nr:sulfite exporter TauE/SafE family protein [Patescibacteria group bacterium]